MSDSDAVKRWVTTTRVAEVKAIEAEIELGMAMQMTRLDARLRAYKILAERHPNGISGAEQEVVDND